MARLMQKNHAPALFTARNLKERTLRYSDQGSQMCPMQTLNWQSQETIFGLERTLSEDTLV
jgi:hypothetical protein